MPTLPYGTDQLIDPAMARALHADACRNHAAVAWAVLWDLPAHPGRYAARLVTNGTTPSCRLLQAEVVVEHLQPQCRAIEVAQIPTAATRHGQHPLSRRDVNGTGLIRVEPDHR